MWTILDARGMLPFPGGGDNPNVTIIGGIPFNLTTLEHFNFTLYDNGTLSNGSWCMLTFGKYYPALIEPNGTWINGTSCYSPTEPIGTRGVVGICFAVAYGLSLVFIMLNLTRHGKQYLPTEKRFYPIGRRWQWYWAAWVCATACISLFTGVDVDRFRVSELPIVLNAFFWYLMQMGTMCCVWEAVRHWGSWMERQFIDPNPFVLQQTDKRGRFEFFLPLVFYAWVWLNFFLVIPRNWGKIELQRDPDQTAMFAEPAATDARFKTATFVLFLSWLCICVSLWHSIRHYEPRNRGAFNRLIGFLGYMPFRFTLLLPLVLAVVGFQGLAAWDFGLSPQNIKTNLVAMYAGGYLPSLLVLWVQIVAGFMRPNEDKALIKQRRERGAAIDNEIGFVKKPAWWQRVNGHMPATNMRDHLMANVREVGGGTATARNVELAAEARAREAEQNHQGTAPIEMNELHRSHSIASSLRTGAAPPPYKPPPYTPASNGSRSETRRNEQAVRFAASLLFPNAEAAPATPPAPPRNDAEATRGRSRAENSPSGDRPPTNGRSNSAASGNSLNAPPQQVRSMLDV